MVFQALGGKKNAVQQLALGHHHHGRTQYTVSQCIAFLHHGDDGIGFGFGLYQTADEVDALLARLRP